MCDDADGAAVDSYNKNLIAPTDPFTASNNYHACFDTRRTVKTQYYNVDPGNMNMSAVNTQYARRYAKPQRDRVYLLQQGQLQVHEAEGVGKLRV